MEKNRIICLDILRIMAAFAVIIIHVSTQFWNTESISSLNWIFMNFWDAISRWAVPVFIMISGCLFLSKKNEISIKILFKKYILRIVMAFIVWTFIYGLFSLFVYEKKIETVLPNITSGYFHMWYLFAITGVYMAYPLLTNIAKEKDKTRYFLIIVFIFSFLISNVLKLCDILEPLLKNDIFSNILNGLHNNLNYIIPGDIIGYSFYFVLGYYLYNSEISKKYVKLIYLFSGISLVLTVIGSILISRYLGQPSDAFFGYFSINVLMISIGVFILIKNLFSNSNRIKESKLITDISNCCFGIYLLHVLVLELLNHCLKINTHSFVPIISIPMLSILIFIICYIVIKVLRKIQILKKYII